MGNIANTHPRPATWPHAHLNPDPNPTLRVGTCASGVPGGQHYPSHFLDMSICIVLYRWMADSEQSKSHTWGKVTCMVISLPRDKVAKVGKKSEVR